MENDLRKIPDTPIIREATSIVKAAVSQNIFHLFQRINAMMEAIDFHFQFLPRWDKGEVAGLLQIGAHMDVIGKNSQMIDLNKRREILTQYPKNFFFLEFNLCLFKSISSFSSLIGLFFPETYFSHNHYNK